MGWGIKLTKKSFNFSSETFGQFKNSLYFCTRNSEQTTERVSGNSEKKRDHWHTNNNQKSKEKLKRQFFFEWVRQTYNGEFDPGSGWTLAGGLTHASRAVFLLRKRESGVRVRNTCATYLYLGDSLSKGRLTPHNIMIGINYYWKLRWIEMGTRKIR